MGKLKGRCSGLPSPLVNLVYKGAVVTVCVEMHVLSCQHLQNSHGTVVLGTAPIVYPASLEDFCSLD